MIRATTTASLTSQIRGALPNILSTAQREGIRTIQIEVTFASPGLNRFIAQEVKRLGGTMTSVGGKDMITFLL